MKRPSDRHDDSVDALAYAVHAIMHPYKLTRWQRLKVWLKCLIDALRRSKPSAKGAGRG